MIERLLAAERAIADGQLDVAERLFAQVSEADPRNAIAVVGLAEVAAARGSPERAAELAAEALAIDPEDAAALRIREAAAATPVPAPAPVSAAGSDVARPRRSALARVRDRLEAWLRRGT